MFDAITYLLWRVWLWLTSAQRVDRFDRLINWHSKNPFEYGLLPSAKEIEYEYPKVDIDHREDVIDFFLQNSKHQALFARISRLGNGESVGTSLAFSIEFIHSFLIHIIEDNNLNLSLGRINTGAVP